MRAGILVLLILAPAASAADAYRAWRNALAKQTKRERTFWNDFQRNYNEAIKVLDQPWRDARAKPRESPNYVSDFSGIRQLYADFAAIQEAKGVADVDYGTAADDRAFDALLKKLLSVAKRIDEIEAEHRKAKPITWGRRFDQRPGIERHGLAMRLAALQRALAKCPNAAEGLAEAWKHAARKDGRKSVVRRVAIIDTLALRNSPRARLTLEGLAASPESSLRVAVAEALIGYGAEARPALAPLLADTNDVVRRALLQEIAARGKDDAGWVAPVVASFPNSVGLLRADHVKALHALTNQTFGDDHDAWKEWLDDYRSEIDRGKFKRDAIEVREAKPKEVPAACAFYGIETPSRSVIFVVEGSRRIWWPADLEVQLTDYKENWHSTRKKWEDANPSHKKVLTGQFELMLGSMADTTSFGLVALQDNFATDTLGDRKLLRPSRRGVKQTEKFLDKLSADGWCSQYAGLLAAARLAGMGPESDVDFEEPRADTVFLWDTGGLSGGRYMTPESAVAAFKRFNRFRRLVVHTIRICDEGEPSETFMRGIAEASGGTYRWAKARP